MERDLFGVWIVIRRWGRIGESERCVTISFETVGQVAKYALLWASHAIMAVILGLFDTSVKFVPVSGNRNELQGWDLVHGLRTSVPR